jgi:hypothetical protein
MMPKPGDPFDPVPFDELAAATREPSLDDVRRLLPVPEQVFNIQHQQLETL